MRYRIVILLKADDEHEPTEIATMLAPKGMMPDEAILRIKDLWTDCRTGQHLICRLENAGFTEENTMSFAVTLDM